MVGDSGNNRSVRSRFRSGLTPPKFTRRFSDDHKRTLRVASAYCSQVVGAAFGNCIGSCSVSFPQTLARRVASTADMRSSSHPRSSCPPPLLRNLLASAVNSVCCRFGKLDKTHRLFRRDPSTRPADFPSRECVE